MPSTFTPLDLPGLVLVQPKVFRDDRGWFLESWKDSEFRAQGIGPFVQENHSANASAGILRGLHYQKPPRAQGKLVRCVRGRIWDVAVDLRPGPTQFRHVAVELDAAQGRMLWVPPGFAHGYQALEDGAEVLYLTTAEYAPDLERSLRWDDPRLAIAWPLPHPTLAPKDAAAPTTRDADLPHSWV
jgi:dTDP-4-dehydrorhamnose 3,5-epimerase